MNIFAIALYIVGTMSVVAFTPYLILVIADARRHARFLRIGAEVEADLREAGFIK